jgi:bacterioferritin (cytochrome b1)
VIVHAVFADIVIVIYVDHHDKAYTSAEEIIKTLTENEEFFAALEKMVTLLKSLKFS